MSQFLSNTVWLMERTLHIRGLHSFLKSAYKPVRSVFRHGKYFLARSGLMPFTVDYLVISVGQACNYKCRDCGNFAPYAPAKFMRYKFDDLSKWITKLAECTDGINTVQIQGGEPFLYSDLGKVITFLRELRRGGGVITDIQIATNGSILPAKELIPIMKSAGVSVRISDYNITPQKTQNLIAFLKEHEIPYRLYSFAGENGRWFSCGGVNLRDYGTVNDIAAEKCYKQCLFRGCLTLERGQLARCSRGNDAPEIQGFTPGNDDYFVIGNYENKSDRRKAFMKYYFYPRHMEACKYCKGTNPADMVEAAVQL